MSAKRARRGIEWERKSWVSHWTRITISDRIWISLLKVVWLFYQKNWDFSSVKNMIFSSLTLIHKQTKILLFLFLFFYFCVCINRIEFHNFAYIPWFDNCFYNHAKIPKSTNWFWCRWYLNSKFLIRWQKI